MPGKQGDSPVFGVYAYPWDIVETGVDAYLRELQAVGLNSTTLACAYHGGKLLRSRSSRGRLAYPKDGTVYFTGGELRCRLP
jgi:hypothetical protein